MEGLLFLVLEIAMVVASVKIGGNKGYSAIVCGVAALFCGPLVLVIVAILPDKKQQAAQARAQQREIDRMNARIRELEANQKQQAQPPAPKKQETVSSAPQPKPAAEKSGVNLLIEGINCRADDPAKALRLFEQANAQGRPDPKLEFWCGQMYFEGEGCTQDYGKALEWFKKAAAKGHADAQYMCGAMYYSGQGCTQDNKKALEWFEKSAAQGQMDAQCVCGGMYFNGEGCTQDYEKALEWLEKSAAQGYAEAQYMCGTMYYSGDGCTRDREKALEWLKKAAAQGIEESIVLLKHLDKMN